MTMNTTQHAKIQMMRNNENLSLDACHIVARNGKMNIVIVAITITNNNNHNNFID
jgi:hypothetical protein